MGEQLDRGRQRVFWIRLTATIVLVSVPLAYGLVVQGVRPLSVFLFAAAAALGLLIIWDGSRLLPKGVVWWARPEPLKDIPTGVYNPAGWTHLLEVEEDRCRRHELPASVIGLELDVADPADDLVTHAADVIQACTRGHDAVACLGPTTFAVLAVNSDRDGATILATRLTGALRAEGIPVEHRIVDRDVSRDLATAWQLASGRGRAAERP